MKKIKILMLTTNSSLMDGINRHILTIAAAINRHTNFEVAVCTVMAYGELHESLENNGVKTFALGYSNGHKLGVLSRYRKVLKEYHPDIIHCHVMALMERIVSSVLYRNIRYVVTIHGIADKKEYISTKERIEKLLNSLFPIPFQVRCYISRGVCDALQHNLPSVPLNEVCYNPIPFKEVLPKKYKLHKLIDVSPDIPIIGTSCRISHSKNPQAFTEVMCNVLCAMPYVHAVVMGDGDDDLKKECVEIIAKNNVKDRFHWLGYRVDAPQLIGDLSCFVLTSRWEGLPTSLLECMAMKIPFAMLIGEGGLRDLALLDQNEGPIAIISPQQDLEKLASGIINLLRYNQLGVEQAERAYRIGRKHFDIDIVSEQLCVLYKKVLK